MVRGKIEIKKTENSASRNFTFCKRREELFKKARELAILCDAEAAIILFSSNGEISEFASSDMQRILARLNRRLESRNLPALEFKPEGPEEQVSEGVDVLKQESQKLKLKQQKLLGKDLKHMDLHELLEREQQLNERLLCINDRKMQIVKEQFEQCRMQEQEVLQEIQTLQRQVEELQGFFTSTSYAVPQSDYFSETECNVGPSDKGLDTSLALAPTWGWLKNEDIRE